MNGPDRLGHLGDFSAAATPKVAPRAAAPTVVDPTAQHASHAVHMALLRTLREAVEEGGHRTDAWDVGQDACFLRGTTLVNIEVKSVTDEGAEQYRLGFGQLTEQVQHHLDHLTAGSPWYRQQDVRAVCGILVVTDDRVPSLWRRIATRSGLAIWEPDRALRVFADPAADGLPPLFEVHRSHDA